MEKSIWEANSHLANQEIPAFYGTLRFITKVCFYISPTNLDLVTDYDYIRLS
jgi:hypothetical protein